MIIRASILLFFSEEGEVSVRPKPKSKNQIENYRIRVSINCYDETMKMTRERGQSSAWLSTIPIPSLTKILFKLLSAN